MTTALKLGRSPDQRLWYHEAMARRDPHISIAKKSLALAGSGDEARVSTLTTEQLQAQVGALMAFDSACKNQPPVAVVASLRSLHAAPGKGSALLLRNDTEAAEDQTAVRSFTAKAAQKKTP